VGYACGPRNAPTIHVCSHAAICAASSPTPFIHSLEASLEAGAALPVAYPHEVYAVSSPVLGFTGYQKSDSHTLCSAQPASLLVAQGLQVTHGTQGGTEVAAGLPPLALHRIGYRVGLGQG